MENLKPMFSCDRNNLEAYSCNFCEFTTHQSIILSEHVKTIHNRGQNPSSLQIYSLTSYICNVCKFESCSLLLWFLHRRTGCLLQTPEKCTSKDRTKLFVCLYCNYTSKFRYALRRHFVLLHKSKEKTELFECSQCIYKTTHKPHLSRHIKYKHMSGDKIKWFECTHCSYKSKRPNGLRKHLLTVHAVGEYISRVSLFTSGNVYKCKKCCYWSTTVFSMQNHLKRHRSIFEEFHCGESIPEPYVCRECKFQTYHSIVFTHHVKTFHKNRSVCGQHYNFTSYVCKSCKFESCSLLFWLRHVQQHKLKRQKAMSKSSQIKWLKCDICDYKTRTRCDLKEHHIFKHINDIEWFECTGCNYKGKSKYYLQSHIYTKHTCRDPIWYKCGFCVYKTATKACLKRHILQHIPDNALDWVQCQHCSHRSKTKQGLRDHVINRHMSEDQIKWHRCVQCSFRCKRNRDLQQHVMRIHGKTECCFSSEVEHLK